MRCTQNVSLQSTHTSFDDREHPFVTMYGVTSKATANTNYFTTIVQMRLTHEERYKNPSDETKTFRSQTRIGLES